ncbi:GSCFA domain-containing protein [Bosea psychrotolerans]|uniref:GSCFA family protein n=1 Tax=Bosea psychrotolerans TaxID=1871628 RepID=A0A2S4MI00_9HYPH|nr:GSCFA domain-containing protein [Bosea psychrotolerans]POR54378.1 GSCFA family protein [Bosea psychrotolerans]
MKIEYDAGTALSIMRGNPVRGWTSGKAERMAKTRLTTGDFIQIEHKPKFQIDPSWPIFTMGSCFAREVENVLMMRGLSLVTRGHGVPAEHFETWDATTGRGGGAAGGELSRGALNKYSVRSMTHELKRVLLDESYPDDGLIELAPDQWFDPHASGLRLLDRETAFANRKRLSAATATIKQARICFFTLGLTETWLDAQTGLAMNAHPGPAWLARMPERFRFIDYGYEATLADMLQIIAMIREHCHPEMRFVVTVSPVPLGATFKDADVIVANSGSKSVLRAVAEELFRRFDYVDYFPSYEIVLNSPRALAFQEDQLHVARDMVSCVMSHFERSYLSGEVARSEAA